MKIQKEKIEIAEKIDSAKTISREMKYCRRCVQPNTLPFSPDWGQECICPPCRYMEHVEEIDWGQREKELQQLTVFAKQNNVSGYDCIVGVSGGKDSTRQSIYVRDKLGLKPLLVSCTYPPEQQTEKGAHNLANLISLGFDTITVGPAPQIWKRLMKQGFFKYGNWCKSTEMALYACLPRVAIAYHIPLIFLGENPATVYGDFPKEMVHKSKDGVFNDEAMGWNASTIRSTHTIASGPDDLLCEDMNEQDIIWYRYPPETEEQLANLKIVYLSYFIGDFNKLENASFSISHGLEIRNDTPRERGSIHPFEALDDDFVFMNQMMKYLKFGFGKVTEETSEEIRNGKMTRQQAIELVKRYDGKCSSYYIKRFCDYIGIREEEFWEVAESRRNKNIWEKDAGGEWRLKVPLE